MSEEREDEFGQVRTSRGFVPIECVEPALDGVPCALGVANGLLFTPVPPTELAEGSPAARPYRGAAPGDALVALASCDKRRDDGGLEARRDLVLDQARELGPLFGRRRFEPLDPWGSAVHLAHLAVTLQQVANGASGLSIVSSLTYLTKRHYEAVGGDESFDLHYIGLTCDPSYLAWLGADRPIVRRERLGERYGYTLLHGDMATGQLELFAFALDREMTASDYRMLLGCVSLSEREAADLAEQLRLKGTKEAGGYGFAAEGALESADAEPGEEDRPVYGLMVRLLVAAHLRDAYVDPFQSDDDTGHLSFRSCLSWMWLDFSKCLGTIRIKYCLRCGRPFSLVGQRGKERVYCSERCKTEAKNERKRTEREQIRAGFMQGRGVAELAAEVLRELPARQAERRVRSCLETWPELKHALDDEFEEKGVRSGLLRRCVAEGLGERVYSSALRARLRELERGQR